MSTLTMSQSEKELLLSQLETKWREKHPNGRARKIVIDVKKEIDKVESFINKASCYEKVEKGKLIYLAGCIKKFDDSTRRSVFVNKPKNTFGSLNRAIRYLVYEDY